MPENITVTLAMPVGEELQQQIAEVDPRLEIVPLTRAQRRAYRGGRPLWGGYNEPRQPDDESDEEAARTLVPILARTEVLLSNPVAPDDLLERAPGVKWVQLTSAGVDRMIESPVVRSEVTVTTASGVHSAPISEYIIGAILAFTKQFPKALRAQAEHAWRPFWPEELEGKTVGIIGVGAIGRRTAEVAKALGCRVLAMRRSAERRLSGGETGDPCFDEMLPRSDLPYLVAESDYIVLALPLTEESRHMIGESELRAMKESAVIVNIGRGGLIDEPVLERALREGWIRGAALDVFQQEPLPPESGLWELENVLITPHISGGTPRYMERAIGIFCDNLRRYLDGEPLRNVVDPSRGY